MSGEISMHHEVLDYIPMIWCAPLNRSKRDLVIWIPGLTGSKEGLEKDLIKFAEAGFVAISFDPHEHGERMLESKDAFIEKINRNKRRYFWPIMAHTAEDIPRVIDWAKDALGVSGNIMAGGISMGGDISIVAAGLDERIAAVAACIATPDWLRPGSDETESYPDKMAWNCFVQYNPITNLHRYRHCPAITFQNGIRDGHVPPEAAHRFHAALAGIYANCPEKLDIAEHDTVHNYTGSMRDNAVQWFLKFSSNPANQGRSPTQ